MSIASEKKGVNMISDHTCVHWWIIGEHLVGHCKKCGATRDFEKLRLDENTRKSIRREKMKNPLDSVIPS